MAMGLEPGALRAFGFDLSAAFSRFREGWAEALRWPALRWLTPEEPVRVLHPDGSESFRIGLSGRRLSAAVSRVRSVAVEMPEDFVLRRSLVLPRLASDEVMQAAELDARTSSPFPEAELAWGLEVLRGEPTRVNIALTSKRLAERRIDTLRGKLGGAQPEIWAGGERPILIRGFGESARLGRQVRARRALVALLVLAGALLAALAVTPTLQLRAQVLEAARKAEELEQAVKANAAMRGELMRLSDQVQLLGKAFERRQDVVALLDQITRQLPDDAFLTRLEIQGNTVKIMGQADNAAQLLQTLGSNPLFREVRAPSGLTRAPSGGKEGFTIEFRLEAEAKAS